ERFYRLLGSGRHGSRARGGLSVWFSTTARAAGHVDEDSNRGCALGLSALGTHSSRCGIRDCGSAGRAAWAGIRYWPLSASWLDDAYLSGGSDSPLYG